MLCSFGRLTARLACLLANIRPIFVSQLVVKMLEAHMKVAAPSSIYELHWRSIANINKKMSYDRAESTLNRQRHVHRGEPRRKNKSKRKESKIFSIKQQVMESLGHVMTGGRNDVAASRRLDSQALWTSREISRPHILQVRAHSFCATRSQLQRVVEMTELHGL